MTTAAKARPFDFVNISFLILSPLVAIFGTGYYVWHYGVTWLEIGNFLLMYILCGLGITAGYHRYFAHKSHECGGLLRFFYLFFGAGALQNSALNWASDHRNHHRYVDRDGDPYNIQEGFFYAHMGWIFYRDERPPDERYRNIPDLMKDPLVRWQHRHYFPIAVVSGFLVPTLIGLASDRLLGGLLWGGFVRAVWTHHMTFLINSLAHIYGTRPYSLEDSSRDNWWLGILAFGEGYHNFHHKFQADYRNGIRWYQFDMTKWWLRATALLGLSSRLRATPESLILKARLEIQMKMAHRNLSIGALPEPLAERWRARLSEGHRRLEAAMAQYQQAKLDYARQRRRWSVGMRRQWRLNLAYYQAEFKEARRLWSELTAMINRLERPARGFLTLTAVLDVLKMRVW